MLKVKWDDEEWVALIDVYRRSSSMSNIEIIAELEKLSVILNNRAQILNIPHDEKYRNLNGLKIMFQNIVYVATNGEKGMSSTSAAMQKMYLLSKTSPDLFNEILSDFIAKYGI